jgi:2-polyprenyl-3-methyl-5-hydroxy-6-metoxy-1,4-benzoquinol methylase
MIDNEKVKKFWDSRAEAHGKVPFESIANLEEEKELLSLKVRHETEVISSLYPEMEGKTVLDLGAGVGQWAFRFADKGASRVTAVEYSAELVRLGQSEAFKLGLEDKVDFVISSAQEFESKTTFDLIFISGLFVYLNDPEAQKLCTRLIAFCKPQSQVIVRDGTGLGSRHEIIDKYSDLLGAQYSAIYRTREEYLSLFTASNFQLKSDSDMFPEGHQLNKYPESRLRVYCFTPTLGAA